MFPVSSFLVRRAGRCAALAAVVYFGLVAAYTQAYAAGSDSTPGRIDFDDASLPPATVEIDLSQGMFGDLFGLGEAAVAGVAESLRQSAGQSAGAEGTQMAAEKLAAVQQILKLAKGVVHEVRVRVYQHLPEEAAKPEAVMSHYDGQLRAENWENVVRIHDGKGNVRISLLRHDGAIQGAFVIVSDGKDLVLANVVGDVSPENVKKLTAAATKIGLENGLQRVLEMKMRQLHHRFPPPPPAPPEAPQTPHSAELEEDR